jgi:hypothetical protein
MTCSLRSTGITPLHHYYQAVRPWSAHRYFRPRGFGRLCLVWASVKRFQNDLFFLLSSSVSLFDLEIPFLRPDPAVLQSRRAQEAVKVGRRTNLSTYSGPCQAMP